VLLLVCEYCAHHILTNLTIVIKKPTCSACIWLSFCFILFKMCKIL